MKNQRMKTEARGFGVSKLAGILLMLVALVCCFTVLSSAAESTTVIRVNPDNVVFTNLQAGDGDSFTAVYGDNVTVALKTEANGSAADLANYTDYGFAAADKGKVYLTAALDTDISKLPVGEHTVNVTFALAYADGVNASDYEGRYGVSSATSLRYTVKILPRPITWAQGSGSVSISFPYVMGQSTYTEALDTNAFSALQFSGVVNGDTVRVNSTATSATFYNVQKAGTAQSTVTVGIDNNNYVLTQPLTVNATVAQIRITQIHWEEYHFTWGDTVVITVLGEGNDGNQYELAVEYDPAYATANGAVGDYTVKVKSPDAANITLEGLTTEHPYHINQKVFTDITFENVNVIGDGRESYKPVVKGTDIPADILALIEYTESGKAFTGTSVYGIYTVTAKLPQSPNYIFKDKSGNEITAPLTATLTIKQQFIVAPSTDQEGKDYQMIVYSPDGFEGTDVSATVSTPEVLRKALAGYRYHTEYTLTINGGAGKTYTVAIPFDPAVFHKYCEPFTANDLYIYDAATGTKTVANGTNGYKVTVEDGRFVIEGVAGDSSLSLIVAPVYNPPFFLTPVGIALLVFLALALLAMLFLIGLYLRRVHLSVENTAMSVDTEGEVPEVVPVVIPDKVDVEESMDNMLDEVSEKLRAEIDAEQPKEPDIDEEVKVAVDEAMKELMDEVNAIELDKEEAAEETDVAEAVAEQMAEEMQETVEAEAEAEAEVTEEEVDSAVEEAIADNFEAEEAAVAVVAEVEEEDELTPEDFKAVVDAIVSDAMCATMEIAQIVADEEATEEAVAEEVVEEAAEEAVAEEVVEEAAEEAVAEEAVAEEVVEEATEEAVAEEVAAEEAAEEVAEEATEEVTEEVVIEEMSGEDICAIVADSVAEAFEMVTFDGVVPAAVEGTTVETITEAVDKAAEENVPENWTEDMTNAVKAAVVDELAARLLTAAEEEAAPAEEAVEAFAEAPVEEVAASDEDDDDDGDEGDEDEDSFGGFGSMPLDYIDAVEEAEKYAEMLEQEKRGEIRIVTRYRRSFQSRLAQSQGNVQDYYSALKNALLSYKGVKNRISWNYEAFNRGRVHVAKMNAKTKTLYLYLALDPAELVDTKYGIVDMSAKKKYATVPVLMKIKGDRKFKYAIELINKLCGENLALPAVKDFAEVDYRVPYQTTEELVVAGVVKKMVAAVPIVYSEAPVIETPVAEETAAPAQEAAEQDVTFVAPADTPAVEAAAEEAPVEEAPVEETPAEEVPASAETPAEENKEI